MQMSWDRGPGGGGREKVTRVRDPSPVPRAGEEGSGPGGVGECPDVWALASGEGRGSLQASLPP